MFEYSNRLEVIEVIHPAADGNGLIVEATLRPDDRRGWLEAYLIRRRSPQPDRLPPLEEAIRSLED